MMVYLASPFSHKSETVMKYREELVSIVAAELTAMYRVTLFMPITQSYRMSQLRPKLFGTTFSAWKDIDLDAIEHCDEVWVVKMDGWKESIGVTAEILYAEENGIPVKFISPKTFKFVKRGIK